MHVPVMLLEALDYLALRPDGTYVDVTCGLAGHSGAIARRLSTGRVLALDRDAESLERAREATADCAGKIVFRQSRFSQLNETLRSLGVESVDGVLADLGVSRFQLTDPERGFTFQQPSPLDMRMCRTDEVTAWDLVNRLPERDLADLIFKLGEERRARRIARAVLRGRPIRDNRHLADLIEAAVPRQGKLHPATLVFQALRMAVNDEPAELDSLLASAPGWIKPGGRFVVIAFHSLDDRKVKTAFRELVRLRLARVLTKHVVRPGEEEVRNNPPSRSAVLRALEIGARGGEKQDGDDESGGHL